MKYLYISFSVFSLNLNVVKNAKKSSRVLSVLGIFYEIFVSYKFEKGSSQKCLLILAKNGPLSSLVNARGKTGFS